VGSDIPSVDKRAPAISGGRRKPRQTEGICGHSG